LGGRWTGGGDGIENPSIDGALEGGLFGYIMPSHVCGVWLSDTNNSDRTLEVVTRPAREAQRGFTVRPEGVQNVSNVGLEGDGPFGSVRPNAGSEGTAGEGVRLSVMVESWVRRTDSTTDSVCEGVEVR
jgi:hypothetical protein